MKKLKLNWGGYIAVFLASAIAFSSCQKQNDSMDDLGEPISLSPEVETRGAVTTTANMTEFTAFGYAHGHQDWADVAATATSNLMFNNKYTKTGNSWVGGANIQWPDNEFKRYSFFAYSPSGSAANKITLLTNSSTSGYQRVSYETLTDVTKQVDLVLASRLNQTPAKAVPLSFGHVLARVGFCAYAEATGVTIKSISINGVKYKGQIEVRRDADWSNISTDKTNFTATINSGVLSTNANSPTMLTGSNGENYFMLLPQDLTANTDNTTCITILTAKDGKDRSLSYTITHNYQKGKSLLYKILIPSGIDPVVDYTVTDWTTTNIPTDIKATYLNVSLLGDNTPSTLFYTTDYTGTVKMTEVVTTGKLTITHDAAKKSFTISGSTGGAYKVQVTAGNLSRNVDIVVPITVTPNIASNISYVFANHSISVSSAYPWSATTTGGDVKITPSSGEAGTTPVLITVNPNTARNVRSITVSFTSVNGTTTHIATWAGTQLANPDYYVGRFAGTIVQKTIDDNTTRYYYSKQVFFAPTDESGTSVWSESGGTTSATSYKDGKSNTALLASSNYPAAYKCITKSGGSWYLPAQDQLIQVYLVRPSIPNITNSYWASNEDGATTARRIIYSPETGSGTIATNTAFKSTTSTLRCMREE